MQEALEFMREGRGDHFDPKILDVFLESIDRVLGIREMHAENAEGAAP
jgi:putative two-component system response regulator